jgi:hypothetical protein
MANHLTPTELARESGLERKQVLSMCVQLGVPVFQGRIDKSLFLASLHRLPQGGQQGDPQASPRSAGAAGAATSSAA